MSDARLGFEYASGLDIGIYELKYVEWIFLKHETFCTFLENSC